MNPLYSGHLHIMNKFQGMNIIMLVHFYLETSLIGQFPLVIERLHCNRGFRKRCTCCRLGLHTLHMLQVRAPHVAHVAGYVSILTT